VSLLQSALFAAFVSMAGPSEGLLSNPKATKHFEAAQAAFNEGKYDVASKELEKAYLIEPADALLYPWAQAERFSGRCNVAIDLYKKFLDTEPSDNFRLAAEENLERCQSEVDQAKAASAATTKPLAEEDTKVEPIEDDGWDEVAKQEPDELDDRKSKPKKDRKWYADPIGGALTGVGVAGVAAGGALIGVAVSRAGKVADEDDNQAYVDARRDATTLRNGGAIALSVGGALLIAGIVRYTLLATKGSRADKKSKKRSAGIWLDGRTSAGVSFQSRF
jgi:tetratricopeptide (TPR) repeat protein